MELHKTEHPFTVDRDVSSAEFWNRPLVERDKTLAWLRANAPVSWHRPMDDGDHSPADHGETGFWAVTRVEEINHVSHHHELFSSELGGIAVHPLDPAMHSAPTVLNTDPPLHTYHRNLMSSAFTPKGVAMLTEKIERRSEVIVSSVVGAGEFDFATRVSSQLPMLTIADMYGVPESLVEEFTRAGNSLIASGAPETIPEGMTAVEHYVAATKVLADIALEVARERRKRPADDIATALALGEIDGRPVTDDEVVATTLVLAGAGNDTTRHTTSWTLYNLWSNPDQQEWLAADYDARIGQAVDEFIRHATVVNMFARTATQDTELAGVEITAGDKVAMLYCSGNRDESVFPDPHRFDVTRPRTNHVAFGGRGVHYCLGNVVAKAQLRALFRQVLTQLGDLELLGEPERQHTEGFNTVAHLPVRT